MAQGDYLCWISLLWGNRSIWRLRLRYHHARDTPSASHGRSASLVPLSGSALARSFPRFGLRPRAAWRSIHSGRCQPRAAHRAR